MFPLALHLCRYAGCVHPVPAGSPQTLEAQTKAAPVCQPEAAPSVPPEGGHNTYIEHQRLRATRRERRAQAQQAVDEALAHARAIFYPSAEGKALYVSGQLDVARGEPERAHQCVTAALAICERLGEDLHRGRAGG